MFYISTDLQLEQKVYEKKPKKYMRQSIYQFFSYFT